jgi:hypothetical protein
MFFEENTTISSLHTVSNGEEATPPFLPSSLPQAPLRGMHLWQARVLLLCSLFSQAHSVLFSFHSLRHERRNNSGSFTFTVSYVDTLMFSSTDFRFKHAFSAFHDTKKGYFGDKKIPDLTNQQIFESPLIQKYTDQSSRSKRG